MTENNENHSEDVIISASIAIPRSLAETPGFIERIGAIFSDRMASYVKVVDDYSEALINGDQRDYEPIMNEEPPEPTHYFGLEIEDLNVRRVIHRHALRARQGMAKYGVTTERQDLDFGEWLQHAQEEAMDFAVYLERIMRDWEHGNV